jgi:hypothetical protein
VYTKIDSSGSPTEAESGEANVETQTLKQGKRLRPVSLLIFFSSLFLIFATLLAAVPQAKKRLTAENVMELLSGGVDPSRVTFLVLDRGVDFELNPKLEKAFQDAGADQVLMAAFRKSGPSAPSTPSPAPTGNPRVPSKAPPLPPAPTGLAIHSQPGGVAIYVDGELKGQTDAQEGLLQVTGLKPGKHRLRATLQGYDDVQGPAVVEAGQLAEIPVTLAQTEAPPPVKPEELPAGKKFLVRHVHRAMEGVAGPAYCQGWMIVNIGYVRYISTDSPHKYMMGTSEIRDAKLSSGGVGVTIKLDFGRKYDFVTVDEKGHEVSAGALVSEISYSMGK